MENEEPVNGVITLGQEDSHYISSVLRMRPGEQLKVVLKDGIEALCEVHDCAKTAVTLKVIETKQNTSSRP